MIRTDIFPEFLKKEDLQKTVRATITAVVKELVSCFDGREVKAVMHFSDASIKPLILNQTNWDFCAELFGPNSDEWGGHEVEIYIEPSVVCHGARVGGIRLRSIDCHLDAKVWTWEQALLSAQEAGIGQEQVKAALKSLGRKTYQMVRDTPIVQALIDAAMVGGDGVFGRKEVEEGVPI